MLPTTEWNDPRRITLLEALDRQTGGKPIAFRAGARSTQIGWSVVAATSLKTEVDDLSKTAKHQTAGYSRLFGKDVEIGKHRL